MALQDKLRTAHEALIEENAADIVITRTEKVREGGGFRETTSTVGTVRARLYQEATGRSGSDARESVAGMKELDVRWGLLCPSEMLNEAGDPIPTDLRAGPNVLDTLETALGRFEVLAVYPRQDRGEVWGWAAMLQRVS